MAFTGGWREQGWERWAARRASRAAAVKPHLSVLLPRPMKERSAVSDRRRLIAGLCAALFLGGGVFPWSGLLSVAAAVTPARPNFVVIFIDDLGYGDLGCFGSPNIRTPRIDRLAAEGVRFTSFYVGAPVCSASRASLLTGRYSARHGTGGVYFPGEGGLRPEEVTVAEVLRGAGYRTACFGKWHLGDAPEFLPTRQGFDEYWGIPYSNDMYIGPEQRFAPDAAFREGWTRERALADQAFVAAHLRNRKAIAGRGLKDRVPIMAGELIVEYPADQSTLTRRYFDRAIDFVRRSGEDPFFLYVAPTMPHIPLHASEAFRGRSRRGLYGDTVEEIDWNVGRLLDAIEAQGLRERTFVIVTSDNGPWLGLGDRSGSAGPLRDGKFSNYEGGVRVPAVASWPGVIPAGTVTSEIVSTLDLLPTFARWAGAELPDVTLDGIDLTGFLRDPTRPPAGAAGADAGPV